MNSRRGKEISKTILMGLLWAGAFTIACSSPYFARRAMPLLLNHIKYKIRERKRRQKYSRTFYYLKRRGMINVFYSGKQLHISLTPDGKKLVGKYKIDDLYIAKPKKWDQKWRILIFDIPDKYKIKREALRGKLKELNLYKLQKSVWVCPYNFEREIEILRDFFEFTKNEMKIITASSIQDDLEIRKFFKLP